MFVPLKITTTEIQKLMPVYSMTEPDVKAMGTAFFNGIVKQCMKPDGTIDGNNLQSLNFPFDKTNYDIFISHSHNDRNVALYLYS